MAVAVLPLPVGPISRTAGGLVGRRRVAGALEVPLIFRA